MSGLAITLVLRH